MRLTPVLLLIALGCGRTDPTTPCPPTGCTETRAPAPPDEPVACPAGRASCDADPSNGCEVDVSGDVLHCGACGNACKAPNGTPACSAGACRIASCEPGFADCDGAAANGCEVRLDSDELHCGTCGAACADGFACRAGICAQLTWTQQSSGTIPSRAFYAATYDAARQRVVVFGGQLTNIQMASDTWEWDGATWTHIATAAAPAGRRSAVMAYDAERRVSVLFGGSVSTSTCGPDMRNDTWEYDGSNWTRVMTPTSPPPRDEGLLTYDPTRKVMVLFGGTECSRGCHDDTWEYDGARWTQRQHASKPPETCAAGSAFDRRRGRVVIFGGAGSSSAGLLDDLWEYDGSAWSERAVTVAPPPRALLGLADVASRRALVLFGGRSPSRSLDDTWEWNGERWREMRPSVSPPRRYGARLVYDEARGEVVLFSGYGATNDTWTYPLP